MKFGLFGGATAGTFTQVPHGDNGGDNGTGNGSSASSSPALERLGLERSDDSHAYSAFMDAVVEAEAMGFHSIFLVEHHFTGAAQVSASLNFLTFLAARTSRIRLGTAVVVVPWHNPVLLAEQAATVDVLSNGRFDFGVGRGYRPNEFERFCIPLEEAGERFAESMALIRKSLTADERFSWHSERWHFEDIIVEPPPVQRPHPPLWLAAGRPESIRQAAADGYCLLLDQFATFDVTLERFRTYRDAVEAEGRTFDPLNVAAARGVSIITNEGEREEAVQKRMAAIDRMNTMARTDDGSYRSSMASDPDLRKAAEQGTLIGTPEQIVEQIHQLRNGGVEYILLSGVNFHPGQLKLFAEEIMPEFA